MRKRFAAPRGATTMSPLRIALALCAAALALAPIAATAAPGNDCRIDPGRALSWEAFDGLKPKAEPPVMAVYAGCSRHLIYVGAVHSNDPNGKTFALVKRAFAEMTPGFVVLEGFPTALGPNPKPLVDHATSVVGTPGDAEPYLSVRLAQASGVPFVGGEPDDAQILAEVRTKGMSAGDLFALYVLRQIEQWVREGELTAHSDPALDARIRNFALAFARDAKVGPGEIAAVATADGFKAWYKKTNALDFDAGYKPEDAWPVTGPHRRPTNHLTVKLSDARDKHILSVIGDALTRHETVLVVYGFSHHDIQAPALEAAFGEPKLLN